MSTKTLRLASYNIQKCVGLDLRRRPHRTLEVIRDLGADIVVLQEADKRLGKRPAALPRALVRGDGWQVVPFGGPASLGWHGNAMLLGPRVSLANTAEISLPGIEPRGAILAEVTGPIGRMRLIGVHLGLLRRSRLVQLNTIVAHISELPPCPTALIGDFNEWRGALPLKGFSFAPLGPSFPAARPIARLDRIALSGDLDASDCATHSAPPARIASDHLPVWAELKRRDT